jgi:hypothetical protein
MAGPVTIEFRLRRYHPSKGTVSVGKQPVLTAKIKKRAVAADPCVFHFADKDRVVAAVQRMAKPAFEGYNGSAQNGGSNSPMVWPIPSNLSMFGLANRSEIAGWSSLRMLTTNIPDSSKA